MRVINDVGPLVRRMTASFVFSIAVMSVSAAADSDAPFETTSTNSISGSVRIFDRKGNERADRSGAVVFVDGLTEYSVPKHSKEAPKVSHKGRQFAPRVLPLVRGDTVDFFNDDNIFHNVFSLSKAKPFDLGIYPEGTSKLVTFTEPGLVKIHCNIHPRMTSTILVLNNDLFATTGPDGSFQIDGIPDGEVMLRVWTEFSDEQHRKVSLSGGEHIVETIDIYETKHFIQHRDKFGKRYAEKY